MACAAPARALKHGSAEDTLGGLGNGRFAAALALCWVQGASRVAPLWLMHALPYGGDAEHAKAKPLATSISTGSLLVGLGWVLLAGAALVAWQPSWLWLLSAASNWLVAWIAAVCPAAPCEAATAPLTAPAVVPCDLTSWFCTAIESCSVSRLFASQLARRCWICAKLCPDRLADSSGQSPAASTSTTLAII